MTETTQDTKESLLSTLADSKEKALGLLPMDNGVVDADGKKRVEKFYEKAQKYMSVRFDGDDPRAFHKTRMDPHRAELEKWCEQVPEANQAARAVAEAVVQECASAYELALNTNYAAHNKGADSPGFGR